MYEYINKGLVMNIMAKLSLDCCGTDGYEEIEKAWIEIINIPAADVRTVDAFVKLLNEVSFFAEDYNMSGADTILYLKSRLAEQV